MFVELFSLVVKEMTQRNITLKLGMFSLTNISLSLLRRDAFNSLRYKFHATPILENDDFFVLCPQTTTVKGITKNIKTNIIIQSMHFCCMSGIV